MGWRVGSRRALPWLVATAVLAGCGGTSTGLERTALPLPEAGVGGPGAAATEVRDAFADFRSALAAGDGPAVVATLSAATVDRYREVGTMAGDAPAHVLATAPPGDRYLAAALRATAAREVRSGLEGAEVVGLLVDHGMLRSTEAGDGPLGDVVVDGAGATAAVSPGSSLHFVFVQEDGTWRLDLRPEMAMASALLESVARARGQDVERVIEDLLSEQLGRRVGPEVWVAPR